MTRRDDKKPGSPTSQDALQDYLQQMLSDGAAEMPAATNTGTEVSARPDQAPQAKAAPVPANIKKTADPVVAEVAEKTSADLQQKLLQARVKDLAEKSVQAAKEKHTQQAQQETERRERMDAARALVKQRIAARIPTDHQPAEPTEIHEADSTVTPEVLPAVQEHKPQAWLENGRPVWGQNAFECLLFSVSGLTLAVPLVELGSIYPIQDHLTPIIGQVDWFMGLLHVHNRNHIRTVNTAKVVMPEKYDPAFVDNIRYVISINGFDWGLAVDNVDKAIRLAPDDVRWRTERSRRPWLAGTVVDYMCALVDVQELAAMLSKADHSKPRVRH
jgi:purine-binding chemotaxis protein CheW